MGIILISILAIRRCDNLNAQNLIPNSQRSPSELKAMTSKGGKKSGEARRRKKQLKEQLEMLMSLPANPKATKQVATLLGIEEKDIDNQMVANVAMFKLILSGGKGCVQAYNTFIDIMGLKDQDEKELRIKRQEAEIERLSLECERLRKEMNMGADSYEDLTPLAEKLNWEDDE